MIAKKINRNLSSVKNRKLDLEEKDEKKQPTSHADYIHVCYVRQIARSLYQPPSLCTTLFLTAGLALPPFKF